MFELEKDWKNLLAGGFAYLTAPFAGHPLDKKRAIPIINSLVKAP